MDREQLGRVAYEAAAEGVEGDPAVGAVWPWDNLQPEMREWWVLTGEAVAAALAAEWREEREHAADADASDRAALQAEHAAEVARLTALIAGYAVDHSTYPVRAGVRDGEAVCVCDLCNQAREILPRERRRAETGG